MFGRDPKLPFNHLLCTPGTEVNSNIDKYSSEHQKRVTEAVKLVQKNTAKKVEERQLIPKETTNDKIISLDTLDLLKKHEKGRSDGSGPIRNVTRTEILDTGTQIVEKENAEDGDSFSEEDRNKTEESETKKDSDTLIADKTRKNYDTVLANKTRKDTESVLSDNSSDSSTKIDHDQPVRRKTTCSTEGKHSNLYKLPKSVLNHNKVQIKENSVLCENKSEYQNVLMKSEKKMINK
ncbi:unnamed protein product [Mytilus coruscus]|uniref:Uncharacterized protein n=1 Tax=Mytilus coruscus TaxID=42192 RepID=A0A6J8CF07_MYTCO|nr:unnamed protein product [Mytilus coruscus]